MSSFARINSRIEVPAFSQAWRDETGAYSVVSLGRTALHFDDPATARALAAECIKAADAMEALPPAQDGGQP